MLVVKKWSLRPLLWLHVRLNDLVVRFSQDINGRPPKPDLATREYRKLDGIIERYGRNSVEADIAIANFLGWWDFRGTREAIGHLRKK